MTNLWKIYTERILHDSRRNLKTCLICRKLTLSWTILPLPMRTMITCCVQKYAYFHSKGINIISHEHIFFSSNKRLYLKTQSHPSICRKFVRHTRIPMYRAILCIYLLRYVLVRDFVHFEGAFNKLYEYINMP